MFGYDNVLENDSLLLDLPFYEGAGIITRDQSKAHHQDIDLINAPEWDWNRYGKGSFCIGFASGYDKSNYDISAFSSAFSKAFHTGEGIGTIKFDGGEFVDHYIEIATVDSLDLDFTSGDYSYGVWFYWTTYENTQMLIGRYKLDVSGWEIYLYRGASAILTQRHHHAGTLVGGNPRSACYSIGWNVAGWHFFGTSRVGGGNAIHYRNGVAVTTITGGLVDPETNAGDLVIGARYTKDANFFRGSQWRPRLWNRAVSANEWLNIFEKERRFFGV